MRVYIDSKSPAGGYLLLEVVLAMGLAAGILSGIFAIASGSLSLAEKVVDEGRLQTRNEAFLNFLSSSFEELPGNAIIELETRETPERFLPTLTIQNAPASFSFAGRPVSAQAIVLKTVPVPSGGVNVVVDYYEEQLLDDNDGQANEEQEPIGSIILYRDIWRFELRALDVRTQEWVSDWNIRGRLPLQVELNAAFSPERGSEVIHHFWIPTKANPSTLVQALQQGGGGARGQGGGGQGGGQPGQGGGPSNSPNPVGSGGASRRGR